MTARGMLGASLVVTAGLSGLAGLRASLVAQTPQGSAAAALAGTVGSEAESRMEGVLISARRQGSTKTITVVTNAEGAYTFPRARLEPGRYDVSIRAAGYALPARSSVMPSPSLEIVVSAIRGDRHPMPEAEHLPPEHNSTAVR